MDKQKSHTFYKVLSYSVTILGSLWMFYLVLNNFNERVLENKKHESSNDSNNELALASKLKVKGEIEKAELILMNYVTEHPDSYTGRLMLSELYWEQCIQDTTNCEQAIWHLNILRTQFPMEEKVQQYLSDIQFITGDSLKQQ